MFGLTKKYMAITGVSGFIIGVLISHFLLNKKPAIDKRLSEYIRAPEKHELKSIPNHFLVPGQGCKIKGVEFDKFVEYNYSITQNKFPFLGVVIMSPETAKSVNIDKNYLMASFGGFFNKDLVFAVDRGNDLELITTINHEIGHQSSPRKYDGIHLDHGCKGVSTNNVGSHLCSLAKRYKEIKPLSIYYTLGCTIEETKAFLYADLVHSMLKKDNPENSQRLLQHSIVHGLPSYGMHAISFQHVAAMFYKILIQDHFNYDFQKAYEFVRDKPVLEIIQLLEEKVPDLWVEEEVYAFKERFQKVYDNIEERYGLKPKNKFLEGNLCPDSFIDPKHLSKMNLEDIKNAEKFYQNNELNKELSDFINGKDRPSLDAEEEFKIFELHDLLEKYFGKVNDY